ncbi:sushi, von Willebrand factor type A, EGF and pentraxin domain-containing protein 1-like [Argiope bruennichi]|uniref:sushi, von Willebrand factor type A, EGF and pentraxin domain-containing protein 1-like n=1 Tax=Argiope bruennichi TaxID=94029 RepID=UPI0024955E06|nr:sushi, von Willebrand factor type A, EGF and pentraxin domain-containing protein 1-like [Argiope bruennichi]
MRLSLLAVTFLVIFINSIAQKEDDIPDELGNDYDYQIDSFNTEKEENFTGEPPFAKESNLKDNETLKENNATTLRHSSPKKGETETKEPLILDTDECGDPPLIKNAIISQGKEIRYEVGAKVTYACEFGYTTDGLIPYSECRLSDATQSLYWTNPGIRCSPRSCGDPGYVSHAHRVGSVFTFPNRVSFECDDGYTLRGYGTRYCQTSGTWSGSLPTCEPIFCDPPSHPENGKVTYSSLGFEAELHYECDSGFILKNDQGRICSTNGTWSGSEPTCQEAQCDPPVAPEHGTVEIIGDKSSVGSMALYTCNEGRILIGSATSRCLDIGEWTFPTPKCLEPCFVPKVEHGKIGRYVRYYRGRRFQELTEGSKIEDNEELYLRCEPNYEPFGGPGDEKEVACIHGEWKEVPVCEPAMCRGPPPPTPHATLARATRTHGGYVVYHCRSYARKVKFGNVTCTFGNWKGVTPVCKDLRCSVEELSFPGLNKGNKKFYKTDEVFKSTCANGYKLTPGNSQFKCVEGEWEVHQTPCIAVSCNSEDLADSERVIPGDEKMVLNGEFLKVTCREGYSPSGEQARCSRGQWTVTGKLCRESSCLIYKIDNGGFSERVEKSELQWTLKYKRWYEYPKLPLGGTRRHGSSVYVSCDKRYTFQGKRGNLAVVTCSKGKWYPDPACLYPGTPYRNDAKISNENAENSFIRPSTTRRPLILTTQLQPSEPDTILDLNQNQNPTPYPSCGCTYRSVDDSVVALVGTEQLKYGSKVQNNDKIKFHCRHFGYSRFNGVSEITCGNCRSWHSSEFPQCVNPQISDTILQFEGDYTILPGGIVGVAKDKQLSIRCSPRAIMEGIPMWSTSITEQLLFSSYVEHSGRSVSMLNISNAAPHHNGQYLCYMQGYRPSTFEIQVISPPSVNCPKFEERDFNIYYENEQAVNSTAMFTCKDHNKKIDGPNIVICLSNGQWSGSPPKCKTVCPIIIETEGMSVSYTNGLDEGSVAGFHCLLPRIRSGVARTTCKANGEWANPPAKCILPSCTLEQLFEVVPENVVPVMDDVTSDTLPYNFTLQLTCDNNMMLSGSNVAKCRQDGTWQVSKVQCVAGCGLPKTENSEMIIEPHKKFYRFGESVSLSCTSGYVLSSEVVRLMCLGTSWSETVLPECIEE